MAAVLLLKIPVSVLRPESGTKLALPELLLLGNPFPTSLAHLLPSRGAGMQAQAAAVCGDGSLSGFFS